MKTKNLIKNMFAAGVLIIVLASCTKDNSSDNNNNNNNNNSQLRTANSFGQTIPQTTTCLKKSYVTGDTDSTHYTYNLNGSMLSAINSNGATISTQIHFSYDNTNRLSVINYDNEVITFDYGTSASQAERIIVSEPSTINDTLYLTYPGGNKIVGNMYNNNQGYAIRDTIEFDSDNNLVQYNTYISIIPGVYNLATTQNNSFNSSIKSPTYPSEFIDFCIARLFILGGDEFLPAGKSLVSELYKYDYVTPQTTHETLVDQQLNSDNYPTRARFTAGTSFLEFNFEYDCN